MYNIKKIRLINLNTHVDTSCEFPVSGAVMVSGINVDKEQRSNGSGKSSVAEGISVALTGESFRHRKSGSSVKDLIRNGEKNMTVEINLEGDKKIFISRTVNSGNKPSILIIHVDDITPAELPTSASGNGVDIDAGNKYIMNSIIGISKDDLFNYYLLSKDTFQSFLSATDGDKKKTINRFSGVEKIDPVFDVIKSDVKAIELDISTQEKSLSALQAKIESEEEHLVEHRASLANDIKQQNINKINERIKEAERNVERQMGELTMLKAGLEKTKTESPDCQADISSLEKEICAFTSDISSVKEKVKMEQEKIDEVNAELLDLKNIRANVEAQVKGAVKCPKCSHEFSLSDKDFDIKEGIDVIAEIVRDMQVLNSRTSTLSALIKSLNEEIKIIKINQDATDLKLKNKLSERRSVELKVNKVSFDMRALSENIESEAGKIKSLIDTLEAENAKEYLLKDNSQTYIDKIESYKLQVQSATDLIKERKESIRELTEQENRFKKFKNYLSNQSLSTIELMTNKYLQSCNSDLTISLDGYRELKSGECREQITCAINRDGNPEGSLNKFSGGEKATVTCANVKALQDIINSTSPTGGLNFTFFDEVNDSVDAIGMSELYDSLNRLESVSMLVSHVRDIGFEKHLFVKKENGVSSVIGVDEFKKITGN